MIAPHYPDSVLGAKMLERDSRLIATLDALGTPLHKFQAFNPPVIFEHAERDAERDFPDADDNETRYQRLHDREVYRKGYVACWNRIALTVQERI